jgi:hypothetical protein
VDVKEVNIDKKDILNSDNEKFMILLVLESGEVSWVMTDDYSLEQKKIFNRVNMILGSPSIILRLCMTIELILIYISVSLGNLFKSNNKNL